MIRFFLSATKFGGALPTNAPRGYGPALGLPYG